MSDADLEEVGSPVRNLLSSRAPPLTLSRLEEHACSNYNRIAAVVKAVVAAQEDRATSKKREGKSLPSALNIESTPLTPDTRQTTRRLVLPSVKPRSNDISPILISRSEQQQPKPAPTS